MNNSAKIITAKLYQVYPRITNAACCCLLRSLASETRYLDGQGVNKAIRSARSPNCASRTVWCIIFTLPLRRYSHFCKTSNFCGFHYACMTGQKKTRKREKSEKEKRKGKVERKRDNEKWFTKLHYERNVTSRNSRYPVSSCIRTVCCGKSRYFKISVSKALQGAVTRSHARCADEIWQGYLLTQTSTRMLGDERCL